MWLRWGEEEDEKMEVTETRMSKGQSIKYVIGNLITEEVCD